MKLIQCGVPIWLHKALIAEGSEWVKSFKTLSGLAILYSCDKAQHGPLKHFSISHFDRYPTWEEILDVKEQLLGDIDAMMVMPQKKDYVNIEQKTFHVWETPKEWGIN